MLSEASTMIHRYKINYMQANLEKNQFIIFDKERQPMTLQLNHNVTIQSVSNVKYTCLNIHVDAKLNFNHQTALLCNLKLVDRLMFYYVIKCSKRLYCHISYIVVWHCCTVSDTKK